MGKKILDSKALYVVLSVLISIALWAYVTSLEGNEDNMSISGIQVHFEGVDILEEKSLFIVGDAPTVTLRVRGPSNTLAKLDNENISVWVDVSQISTEGQFTQEYNVSFTSSNSGSISIVSQNPNKVTFTVARYLEREIEVCGRFDGTVAEGYLPGDAQDFKFSPATIKVSGEASLVNQVSSALVVVDGEDLTDSIAGEYSYQLIGNDGEEMAETDLTCSVETVYTTFPIRATKEVPLTVNLTSGGGVSADSQNVKYDIEPSSITVAGSREDVNAIDELMLQTIDLATVRDGDVLSIPIPLNNELENLSGTTEATVTFHISGVTTKSVETTNISCIGVPDGWQETLVTQAMTVEIRGTAAALEAITGENVRVVADLSEVNPTERQLTVTPRIYLVDQEGSDAGVFGTDYRVVVSLSKLE